MVVGWRDGIEAVGVGAAEAGAGDVYAVWGEAWVEQLVLRWVQAEAA